MVFKLRWKTCGTEFPHPCACGVGTKGSGGGDCTGGGGGAIGSSGMRPGPGGTSSGRGGGSGLSGGVGGSTGFDIIHPPPQPAGGQQVKCQTPMSASTCSASGQIEDVPMTKRDPGCNPQDN